MALKALYLSKMYCLESLIFSISENVFCRVRTCEECFVVKDMDINVRVAPRDNRHEKEMLLTVTQHSGLGLELADKANAGLKLLPCTFYSDRAKQR